MIQPPPLGDIQRMFLFKKKKILKMQNISFIDRIMVVHYNKLYFKQAKNGLSLSLYVCVKRG